ncbi:integral membrane protein [Golovinomyces cichoracearum]|uniref:Integral membrane protein n=1 Tax=Golovinomyces cichoracearum TaxID=62708 RepID=A0A420HML5_9PEZI|nr:integral membrane protein [Golovinomyces cichoracearum]
MSDTNNLMMKASITKHMNSDHSESIELFLQHFSQLSPEAAQGATIQDISLSELQILTTDSTIHRIPLEPPMASLQEARERMKDMDNTARRALKIEEQNLVPYQFPKSLLHVSVMSTCLVTFLIFGLTLRGDFFVPGRYVYDKILPFFPGGPETFLVVAKVLALPTLAIHAGELLYLDSSRLKKNGIKRGTALWWQWAISCYAEGFGSFQRFDAKLKKMKLGDKNTKH